jgi:tRNA (cytidine/uridine-2'-O-)-methyltransferase
MLAAAARLPPQCMPRLASSVMGSSRACAALGAPRLLDAAPACSLAACAAAAGEPAAPLGRPPPPGAARHAWQRADLAIVLVHPQIPQNVGNVARTCAATNIALHLVGPLGFELDDAKLRRAGLDYWHYVSVAVHPSWAAFEAFRAALPCAAGHRTAAFTKFSYQHYASEGLYRAADGGIVWLVFGAETTGLPDEAVAAIEASAGGALVKIPMANAEHVANPLSGVRSLNLATSVGIGVFEALRQLDGAVLPEARAGAAAAAATAVESV